MTDTSIEIRPARADDVATIADFNARMAHETEGLTLDRAILDAGVRSALADANKGRYFVADAGEKVVGQLMITLEWSDWRNGEIWWIQSVYVHVDYRGRGIFKKLYRHVAELARQQGAAGLRLYVERENGAAQKTYAQLGMSMTHYLVMEEMFDR